MRFKKRAFTIIELMVVVAIIGVLAGIATVSYNNSQKKSRDSRRMADFDALKTAILLYKDDSGHIPVNPCASGNFCTFPYPAGCTGTGCSSNIFSELTSGHYIEQIPTPPAGPGYSYYITPGTGTTCGTTAVPATCGFLMTGLESWSGTNAYPGSYRGTSSLSNYASNGYYTCEIGQNNSSYCISVQ